MVAANSIDRGGRRSVLTAILVFATTLLLILSIQPLGNFYSASIVIMSIAFAFTAAALVDAMLRPAIQPVYLTALLYILTYFVGPGLVHLHLQHFPFYNIFYTRDTAFTASIVVLLFISCIILINIRPLKLRDVPSRKISKARFPILFLILAGVVIFATFAVGYEYLTIRRGDAYTIVLDDVTPAQLIFAALARMGSFILFSLCVSYLRMKSSLIGIFAGIISFAIFVIVNNPVSLPRYVIGAYAIIFFFTHFKQTPLKKSVFVILMILAQLTVFPLLSNWTRGDQKNLAFPNPIEYVADHGDFDGFQSTMNVVVWVDGAGEQWGTQLASAALFFVPRKIIPWKSRGTGGDSAAFVGYQFTNISSPMPSELYVDFGYPGLIVFSVILSILIRYADTIYYSRSMAGDRFGLFPTAVAAGYVMILFRGSLIGVLGPFVLSEALAIGAIWYLSLAASRNRNRRVRVR